MRNLRVISAFCNVGQQIPGVELGSTRLLKYISQSNTVDLITNFESNNSYIKLNNLVKKSIWHSRTCILGGDHSICCATVPAFFDVYKENGHLLWIDAHADINTKYTSLSGNTHGMPLAKVFGLEDNIVISNYSPSFNQLTYLGVRDLDLFEKNIIINKNIKCFNSPTDETKLMEHLKNKTLYISFDVDSLEPKEMPCTGTKVSNGIQINKLCTLIQNINKNCNIKCFDIVEYNPKIGTKDDVMLSEINIAKYIDAIS